MMLMTKPGSEASVLVSRSCLMLLEVSLRRPEGALRQEMATTGGQLVIFDDYQQQCSVWLLLYRKLERASLLTIPNQLAVRRSHG